MHLSYNNIHNSIYKYFILIIKFLNSYIFILIYKSSKIIYYNIIVYIFRFYYYYNFTFYIFKCYWFISKDMFKKYFNANYNHNKKYRFYLKNSKLSRFIQIINISQNNINLFSKQHKSFSSLILYNFYLNHFSCKIKI